jgi:GGDEF domain-containing protein
MLKRLQKELEKTVCCYEGKTIEVGLSFGLSTYTGQFDTKELLFDAADKDMYVNKKNKAMT